jgi:hypothetical protein
MVGGARRVFYAAMEASNVPFGPDCCAVRYVCGGESGSSRASRASRCPAGLGETSRRMPQGAAFVARQHAQRWGRTLTSVLR